MSQMEYLESLGQSLQSLAVSPLTPAELSEVTMYDVKSAIAQAKAVAMNWTEYEQKARLLARDCRSSPQVREATNDDGPCAPSLDAADSRSMVRRTSVRLFVDRSQGRQHDLDERDRARVRSARPTPLTSQDAQLVCRARAMHH